MTCWIFFFLGEGGILVMVGITVTCRTFFFFLAGILGTNSRYESGAGSELSP